MTLIDTLGNEQWIREHEVEIRKLLPDTWTHINNIHGLKLGFGLKLLGVDWRSDDEFGKVMVFLERIGILQRQNGSPRLRTSQTDTRPIFAEVQYPARCRPCEE